MPSLAHRRDVARGRPERLLVPCAAQETRTRVWNRILAARVNSADVRLALTISATKSSRMQQGSLHARRCPPPSPYDGERRERERVMIGLWRLMHSRWSIYNNVTFFGLPRHGELLAGLFLAVCVYFCGVTASKQKIVILLPLLPELDSGP